MQAKLIEGDCYLNRGMYVIGAFLKTGSSSIVPTRSLNVDLLIQKKDINMSSLM
jgi:hypothetical protein